MSLIACAARPSDTSSSFDFLAMMLRSTVAAPDVTARTSGNRSPPVYAHRLVRILAAPTPTALSLSASTRRSTTAGAALSILSQLCGLSSASMASASPASTRTASPSSVMPCRKNMARRSEMTLPVPPIFSRASLSMASRVSTSALRRCSSRWLVACCSTARMLLTVNTISATSRRSCLPVLPVVSASILITCSDRFTALARDWVITVDGAPAAPMLEKSMILSRRPRALPILLQLSWSCASLLMMRRPSRLHSSSAA
ncbi:hypothetical protein VPH35_082011 [Triticum aestivum]|uniref:Uncharacterized protein n=1 Tax=Triticum urartu TaxID=4572 RepID=A0A8R7QD79_TRIUA